MTKSILTIVASFLLTMNAACTTNNNLPSAPAVSDTSAYRLGSGDMLRIVVYGEDRLSGEFKVNDDGKVGLPLIGQLQASGLTIAEMSQAIGAAYSKGILLKPQVAVEVKNYRPFFILGEVGRPGQYEFIPGMTVRQAIATASGFSYRAKEGVVMITRWGETEEKAFKLEAGTVVMPGDTIRIPERHF